eukprot:gb/GECG01014999.1/.p1 GENE.gb/GECG01014999.1/~~gb/GECG01014999.1/.p1  ORF type:complete len:1465 (+),score=221.30 gb/GECG01014999.1/:1-4395(+)
MSKSSTEEQKLEFLLPFWKQSFDTPLSQEEKFGLAGKYRFRKQKLDARRALELDVYDAKAAKKCLEYYSLPDTVDGLFRLYLISVANEWNYPEILRRSGVSSKSALRLYDVFGKLSTVENLLDILEQAVGGRREYHRLIKKGNRVGTADESGRRTARSVTTIEREFKSDMDLSLGDEKEMEANKTAYSLAQEQSLPVVTVEEQSSAFLFEPSSTARYDLKPEVSQAQTKEKRSYREAEEDIPQLYNAGIPAVNAQRLKYQDLFEAKLIDEAVMDSKYSTYAENVDDELGEDEDDERPTSRSDPRRRQLGLSRSHELARWNAARFGKNFFSLLSLNKKDIESNQSSTAAEAHRINELTKTLVASKRILRNQEQPIEAISREKYLNVCEETFTIPLPRVLYGLGTSSIVMRGWSLTDSDVYALTEALALNATVEHLDLGDNQISEEGASYIASAIERNAQQGCKLQRLNVSKNHLCTKGGRYIIDAVSKHGGIETLDISDNQMEDGISSSLRTLLSLKAANHLISLDLSGQKLRDGSLAAISDWLSSKGASFISTLRLGWNMFSKASLASFFYVVSTNSALKRLYFDWNNFGEEAGIAVAYCLLYNKVIEEMSLSNCRISGIAGVLIADALRYNEKLEILDLNSNPIGSYAASIVLDSIGANGYRVTNIGLTNTEASDTARKHVVVHDNKNARYPFRSTLPSPHDVEVVEVGPRPEWSTGVSHDISFPDGHYALQLDRPRDHIVANLLLMRVKTGSGVWNDPKLRNRFVLKQGQREMDKYSIPDSINKSVMAKLKSPKFLQFEFVSKRVSKPSSALGGSRRSSQAKMDVGETPEVEVGEEEQTSYRSEEGTADEKVSAHLSDCEEQYGDELPSSCLRILLEGGHKDHKCLARALKSLEIVGLGSLQRVRLNSGVLTQPLEVTDLAEANSWDEILRVLEEDGTLTAIEYTSTVLSLCATLRFSLSKESEQSSLLHVLEDGDRLTTAGSQGAPWRKLKHNGKTISLHTWRAAGSLKSSSNWKIPSQGVVQMDYVCQVCRIMDASVHLLDLRNSVHSTLLSKMREETRMNIGYFIIELEEEVDDISTEGIFTLLHRVHEQCRLDAELPPLNETADTGTYKRVLEVVISPAPHDVPYHFQELQLDLDQQHDKELFESLRLRSKGSAYGRSLKTEPSTLKSALKKVEQERAEFAEEQWREAFRVFHDVSNKKAQGRVSPLASSSSRQLRANEDSRVEWLYSEQTSGEELAKRWGKFHKLIVGDALKQYEGISKIWIDNVQLPVQALHLPSWITPVKGRVLVRYCWWASLEPISSTAFSNLCEQIQNQTTDVDRMGLLRTVCEDENLLGELKSQASESMYRPSVGSTLSENDVVRPLHQQIINSILPPAADGSFYFSCTMIKRIVSLLSFSQGKASAASLLWKFATDPHLFATVVWIVNEAKSKENALTEFIFQREQEHHERKSSSQAKASE